MISKSLFFIQLMFLSYGLPCKNIVKVPFDVDMVEIQKQHIQKYCICDDIIYGFS
jgi:hypothetical protein